MLKATSFSSTGRNSWKSLASLARCHTSLAWLVRTAYSIYSSAGMRVSWPYDRRSSSTCRRTGWSSPSLRSHKKSSSSPTSGAENSLCRSPASTPRATPRPSAVSLGATVVPSRYSEEDAA